MIFMTIYDYATKSRWSRQHVRYKIILLIAVRITVKLLNGQKNSYKYNNELISKRNGLKRIVLIRNLNELTMVFAFK